MRLPQGSGRGGASWVSHLGVSFAARKSHWKGLHAVGTTDRQRAIRNADDAVSLMIREHDKDLPCILAFHNHCDPRNKMTCGHYVERAEEATRYHPWNLSKECSACNSSHVSRFRPDKGAAYTIAIDEKWGAGTASFLFYLAFPKHEKNAIPRNESWSVNELEQITSAARMGYRAYEQVYFELRGWHRPNQGYQPGIQPL